ncbi:bifunctional UDP-N-acetylglucosamine diphosphorylase/glucosamine-1-phosphate N-acetyltransferase GlmU [Desulfovibrio aerotolerans]|uniref:Bifunctional protein GlmU n=1 Tax=Solidesulfovibrio aerotolerans TaxID=295255 RepID=A0A7C9NIB8_9BACT|nr:bifunctional UDP-N-acetylglucosamine diphosphorylase/glucosamine-1-phosphate N-acetyltransferase GlmU [Solidesulfovibrio aerotolerans]MYL82396.1 bifunctional UDP-N-acetylglucosamine diphosphorylase/glucosamine-1-phosphate N-acetyltransferase GlmU [Solidesulfovibrio aerotolerans]
MTQRIGALALAAGKGTRMRSDAPKVLKTLLGKPMLWYVTKALATLYAADVWTVIGHRAESVAAAFPELAGRFVTQTEQLGTGHALVTALPALTQAGLSHVLVVNGDAPLVTAESIEAFCAAALAADADVSFVSIELPDPGAYGRVVRCDGRVAIVEAKDFDPARHGTPSGEINAGVYLLRLEAVAPLLGRLSNANNSGEYYITDLVSLGEAAGLRVLAVNRGNDAAYLGINSPRELVAAEEILRRRIVDLHIEAGVVVRMADSVRLGPQVRLAPGVEVCGPLELYGRTTVAAGASLASHCVATDAVIGENVVVQSFCHLDNVRVDADCQVGPYARLRPGAILETGARVGNFVEMKKSVLGPGAKAGHLTYLGDAEIGAGVNIGAGTITCNYDGVHKHKTVVGREAFIGSNTALVAPVTIGAGALVGAGSVITSDVPDGMLALGRGRQVVKPRK